MERLKIIEAMCVGCGQCALACEAGAFASKWGRAELDEDLCVSCWVCLDFCPVEALEVERDER